MTLDICLYLHINIYKRLLQYRIIAKLIMVVEVYFIEEQVMGLIRTIEQLAKYNQEEDVMINLLFHGLNIPHSC